MKKIFCIVVLAACLVLGFSPMSAAADNKVFIAQETGNADGFLQCRIEFFRDILIVNLEYRGRDNQWRGYYVEMDTDKSEAGLRAFGAFSVNYYKEISLDKTPADGRITGLGTENPLLIIDGREIALKPYQGTCGLHYDNKRMIEAYGHYLKHPDAYPKDSVDVFPAHKYAILSVYDSIRINEANAARTEKKEAEIRINDTYKWVILALLIPLIILIVISARTRDGKFAGNIRSNLRSIVLTESFAVALCCIALPFIFAIKWPYVIAFVLFVLAISGTFLIFTSRTIDYVKAVRGGRFPWIPTILFSYVTLITIVAILTIILRKSLRIQFECDTTDLIIGIVSAVTMTVLLGLWLRNSLVKNAPELRGTFVPVALVLLFGAIAAVLLCVFIISLALVGGVAKSSAGNDAPNSSGNKSSARQCSNCKHLRWNLTCPYSNSPNAAHCEHYQP